MQDYLTRDYVAQQSGAAYQVSIWTPAGEPPAGGWPVVYVLDAKAMFATFVEAIQRSGRRPDATGIGMAAVVGIAHGGEHLFATEHRYRDYTFEASSLVESAQAGGGRVFLGFIVDQLAPELSAEFSFNRERQSLFGHSLAGYFVLNALAIRPQAFCYYAAISPSVWWQPEALTERLQQLDAAVSARVLIATGEWEGQPAPWIGEPERSALITRRAPRAMLEHAAAAAELLAQRLSAAQVRYRCFPEEDHSSVVMIGIQRSLRQFFE
ncbi:MAG: alpha/beta hydrolase [Oceanisphaera sp.]